ncbi:MAG: class I mannose-6-phosphate isomerase, partial [Candidatus Gallimonas sp.]
DADEDACIYVGFNRDVTSEELREHIANHTLMKLLNRIPVKKGESYFLKAGTVHAIGAGCLICEIQQSSNVTYRLYDYGRKDKNGRERELHLEKALDVLDMKESSVKTYERYEALIRSEYVKTLIGQCKYFTVMKYSVDGECVLPVSEASFRAVVFIEGRGVISDGTADNEAAMGDTWFSIANVQITIKGKCTALVVNI